MEQCDRQWLFAFRTLYEQASPLLATITSVDGHGAPRDLEALLEGGDALSLLLGASRSMRVPRDKHLRALKRDFESVLQACLTSQESARKLVTNPNHSRVIYGGLVFSTTLANGLMEKLAGEISAMDDLTSSETFFHDFVGEQLMRLLPYRKRSLIFGPQVCELNNPA